MMVFWMLTTALLVAAGQSGVAPGGAGLATEDSTEELRAAARGGFLITPDDRELRHYEWKCTEETLELDREENVKNRKWTASFDAAQTDGRLQVTATYQDLTLVRPASAFIVFFYPDDPEVLRIRDLIWEMTEFTFVGRADLDGRETLVYAFRTPERLPPDGGLEERFKAARKYVLGSQGRIWFDKQDRKLVQVEGEYYRSVTLARGGFASGVVIDKGTRWSWRMARNQRGDWLPQWSKRTVPKRNLFPSNRGFVQTLRRYSGFRRISLQ